MDNLGELSPLGGADSGRVDAEIGYGLPMRQDRVANVITLGYGKAPQARQWSLGFNLRPLVERESRFDLGLDVRREERGIDGTADHAIVLRGRMVW